MNIYVFKIAIIILGLAGFILANFIHNKKKLKKPLICPLRFKCTNVIESDYSKILGINIEVLGMIYYATLVVGYSLSSFFLFSFVLNLAFFILCFGAVIFSVYLLLLQAFVIKEWCMWCVFSACISTIIFILSYMIHFVL